MMNFPGWRLIGRFPDEEDGVGSWLLHHNGEAALLELPPGLRAHVVKDSLSEVGATLGIVTASHSHEDHFDIGSASSINRAFPRAVFVSPMSLRVDRQLSIGGETLYLLAASKHSMNDVVTVFRGVAMTGDIELGQIESVNDEVPERVKRSSMRRLGMFQDRTGYRVHSIVSAHLNDARTGINWPDLFNVEQPCRT